MSKTGSFFFLSLTSAVKPVSTQNPSMEVKKAAF